MIQADEVTISSCVTRESASVAFRGEDLSQRGAAEATNMGNFWYLNRVVVQPHELRGRGIGSRLLQTLIQELRDKARAVLLVVDPGGYTGDTARQRRFYEKKRVHP